MLTAFQMIQITAAVLIANLLAAWFIMVARQLWNVRTEDAPPGAVLQIALILFLAGGVLLASAIGPAP